MKEIISLPLNKSEILNVMCFPWWYYVIFDIISWIFLVIPFVFAMNVSVKLDKYVNDGNILNEIAKEKRDHILSVLTDGNLFGIPKDIWIEIVSYIPDEWLIFPNKWITVSVKKETVVSTLERNKNTGDGGNKESTQLNNNNNDNNVRNNDYNATGDKNSKTPKKFTRAMIKEWSYNYIHSRCDVKIFRILTILYQILSILMNIFNWYLAIKYWGITFKKNSLTSWAKFQIIMFDSTFILPSYISYNATFAAFSLFYSFFDKSNTYLKDKWYNKYVCIKDYCNIPYIYVFTLILQVPLFCIGFALSMYVFTVAGAIIFIPITLIWCLIIFIYYITMENIDKIDSIKGIWQLFFWIYYIIMLVTFDGSAYVGFNIINVSAMCFYNKNSWTECIRYAGTSQYCPNWTFNRNNYESWIMLVKWTFF